MTFLLPAVNDGSPKEASTPATFDCFVLVATAQKAESQVQAPNCFGKGIAQGRGRHVAPIKLSTQ